MTELLTVFIDYDLIQDEVGPILHGDHSFNKGKINVLIKYFHSDILKAKLEIYVVI